MVKDLTEQELSVVQIVKRIMSDHFSESTAIRPTALYGNISTETVQDIMDRYNKPAMLTPSGDIVSA